MFSKFKGAMSAAGRRAANFAGAVRDRFKGSDKEKAFAPTPLTKPPVFPDKDRFILRFACAVFAVISGKFTYNVIRDFFSMVTLEELAFAGVVAAAVTALEYSALRKAIFTHSIGYMSVAGMIAIVSILGSFGAYQGAFVKNMINSFEYQSAQRQIENLDQQIAQKQQQAAEFKATGQMINARDRLREADQLIAQRNAAQGGLSSAREMGAAGASGNAVISSLSRWTDSNVEATADTTNTVLSIGVELIFLILTGLSALEEKRARRLAYALPYPAGSAYSVNGMAAPPGTPRHPETAFYPVYYPEYYQPTKPVDWQRENAGYPRATAQPTQFKIPVGFGRKNGSGSPMARKNVHSPALSIDRTTATGTVPAATVIYRDRYVTLKADPGIEGGFNAARRKAKQERLVRVKTVLSEFPEMRVAEQAKKAGLPLSTFSRLKSELMTK